MAKQKKDAKSKAASGKGAPDKSAAKKKSAANKSAGEKSGPQQSAPKKKSSGKKSEPKKSGPKKSGPKKSAGKKSASKSARSSTGTVDLPGTLKRSPPKVQRTYEKTLDSAEAGYGDEERAHRTAWGAVKNVAEKRGDHWELKDATGPSDSRSQMPADKKRAGEGETFGGVDVVGNSRQELLERAKKAGIRGYSRMTKAELGRQLSRHE